MKVGSGRPLNSRSLEVINMAYGETQGKIPIVGVGGIESKETAWEAIILDHRSFNFIRHWYSMGLQWCQV